VVSERSLAGRARARLALGTRAREAREQVHAAQYARWRSSPVRPRTVLYESFSGNGMLDNPEAIFRRLLTEPDMADLEHIWVLDEPELHPEVQAEFADNPNVRFVKIRSAAYLKALATSQYLINNATFPQELAKRPEQTYVNTWHGVPLKHMGFDMARGGVLSRNITRNFLNADYLLSANRFMTDVMYRGAYRMQGIYRGAVIEEGHPRTDRQVEALADPASVLTALEERGVSVDGRKVVLYAPTWRGDSFQEPHVNAAQLLATVRDLQRQLDPEQHVVLLKVHQVIYNAVRDRVGECDFLVPNSIPTNQTLAVADTLVTDYSSIFFDYLSSGRPVVHYVPDLDEYRSGRGLYLPESDLPGPICATMPHLVEEVSKALVEGTSARSSELALTYAPKDDGDVCGRIVDLVFRGADESQYTVHRDFSTDKETMLIYLGSLKSQGITTSAVNLLSNIDYDRYDVTAFFPFSKGRDRVKNAGLIDPRVRVIPRAPQFNGSPARIRQETKRLMQRGLPESLSERHVQFWTDEWQRMLGHARFDHLIDFSGYGCYAPFLFSVAEAKHKSVWLHNDMYADMQRETVGEKHLEDRLQAVFTTYRYFDHLVSVSPELERVNREGLSAYAPPEKFTHAVNTIDGERVLRMAGLTKGQAASKAEGQEVPTNTSPRTATFDTENIASAVTALLEHFEVNDLLREARSRLRLGKAMTGATTTFVTVGRLSPEKNHARLIRAFARVHEKHPHIRLLILGGGKLEPELNDLVNNLGMESAVTLTGQVDNPFAIMADADCFVLSSDYEGQPMVILEARTLGLPVITTAFSSVGDSVPPDAGLVVPQSVKSVAEGLERFIAGEVPASVLDTAAYNARAMAQFDAAIHQSATRDTVAL
jgi:CDP-glycerol glycerophosphotransferase